MVCRTRFAPSPTGLLHIGNARSAVLNWAYAKNKGGEFILRIDDTDLNRSKKEFEEKIKIDLSWLGLKWNKTFNQSQRQKTYEDKIKKLKDKKRIYPCFESQEELSLKKKSQLTSGKPPIYDRSSLNLSESEINKFLSLGKKPHWRFKIEEGSIIWNDIIKGKVGFDSKNLSDPVLIREDGSLLYHLPSVIDDIEEDITDIIRGEDHITNTAFHIQIFQALDANIPNFGHHPFLTDDKGKGFGKRLGSLSIEKIRNDGFENITLLNYLTSIGTSSNLTKEINMKILLSLFNISNISSSSPKFSIDILILLNKEILQKYDFKNVKDSFSNLGIKVSYEFWNFVKNNINFLSDSLEWKKIIDSNDVYESLDKELLIQASKLLPNAPFTLDTWDIWTSLIKDKTGKKGKELYMPLRVALTGRQKGPELKYLLPLLSKDYINQKLGIIS